MYMFVQKFVEFDEEESVSQKVYQFPDRIVDGRTIRLLDGLYSLYIWRKEAAVF